MTDNNVLPTLPKFDNVAKQQKFAVTLFAHNGGIIRYFSAVCVTRTSEFANKFAQQVATEINIKQYPVIVLVLPIGYWTAINPNFNELITAYNQTEANESLNAFMKSFMDELAHESKVQKERKDKALEAVVEKKEGAVVTGKYYNAETGIEKDKLNTVIDANKESDVMQSTNTGVASLTSSSSSELVAEEIPAPVSIVDVEGDVENAEQSVAEEVPFVNYLTVDKLVETPVKEAKFFTVQFLTPETFPIDSREKYANQKYYGIKFKEFHETDVKAKEQAEYYNKKDKFHDTPVCEVGKWYEFGYDINTVKTEEGIVYQEKALNEFMQVVHEKELAEQKKEEVAKADVEGDDEDESEAYENLKRNKLAMQMESEKDVVKKSSTELAEEKLAEIQRKKAETKRKLADYEKSKKKLDADLGEIEKMFDYLNNEE
jgi:hypothetical protein